MIICTYNVGIHIISGIKTRMDWRDLREIGCVAQPFPDPDPAIMSANTIYLKRDPCILCIPDDYSIGIDGGRVDGASDWQRPLWPPPYNLMMTWRRSAWHDRTNRKLASTYQTHPRLQAESRWIGISPPRNSVSSETVFSRGRIEFAAQRKYRSVIKTVFLVDWYV